MRYAFLAISAFFFAAVSFAQEVAPPTQAQLAQRDALWEQAQQAQDEGRHTDACRLGREMWRLERTFLEPSDRDRFVTLNWLAAALRVAGDADAADGYAREALDWTTRHHGRDHWETVTARLTTDYWAAYRKLGAEAQARLQAADESTARAEALIAADERLEEAVELCDSAFATFREVLGETHPRLIGPLYALGAALRALGRREEAEFSIARGRQCAAAAYGADHPRTAAGWNLLGLVQLDAERFEPAEAAIRQAIRIEHQAAGASEERAIYVGNLLDLLRRRAEQNFGGERFERAARDLQTAQAFSREFLETDEAADAALLRRIDVYSQLTADQRTELRQAEKLLEQSTTASKPGTFSVARKRGEEALAIRSRILGREDPETALAEAALGKIHFAAGDSVAAAPCLERADAVYAAGPKAGSDAHAEIVISLAASAASRGEHASAQELFDRARTMHEKRGREFFTKYDDWLAAAPDWCLKQNAFSCADLLFAQILARTKSPQEDEALLARVDAVFDAWKAAVVQEADQTEVRAEAEKLVTRRLARRIAVYGESDLRIADALMESVQYHELVTLDFTRATELLRQRDKILTAHYPVDDPRLGDSRYAIANVSILVNLSADQRKELARAKQLSERAIGLRARRQWTEALTADRQASEIRRKLLGDRHPLVAESLNGLAMTAHKQKNFASAKEKFEQALALQREVMGDSHPQVGATVWYLALVCEQLKDQHSADALFRQALDISRRNGMDFDLRVTSYAEFLQGWAESQWESGAFVESRRCLEGVERLSRETTSKSNLPVEARLDLADFERIAVLSAPDRRRLTDANRLLLAVYLEPNQNFPLQRIAEVVTAAKTAERLLGKEYRRRTLHLNALSKLFQESGNGAAAVVWSAQALQSCEAAYGERSEYFIRFAYNHGVALDGLGRRAEADGCFARAERMYRELFPQTPAAYFADLLRFRGDIAYDAGEYRRAEQLAVEAIQVYEQVASAGQSFPRGFALEQFYAQQLAAAGLADGYLETMRLLARTAQLQSNFAAAIRWSRRVVEVARAVAPPDPALLHGALDLLRSSYIAGDDFDLARMLGEEIERLQQQPGVVPAFGALTTKANRGWVEYRTGHTREALAIYEEVQRGYEKLGAAKTANYSFVVDNLGLVTTALGDYDAADKYFQQALALKSGILGKKHLGYGYSVHNLGELRMKQDRAAEALPLFRQAADIYVKAEGPNGSEYLLALTNLASARAALGDAAEARQRMREVLELSSRRLNELANHQTERQQLRSSSQIRHRLDKYLTAKAESQDADARDYEFVLAWKGGVLQRQQTAARLRAAADAEALRAVVGVQRGENNEVQVLTRSLSAMTLELQDTSGMLAAAARDKNVDSAAVGELVERRERLAGEILRLAPPTAETPPTPERIRQSLPPGAAVVDLVEYNHDLQYASPRAEATKGKGRIRAYVLSADGAQTFDLGPADAIAAAVDQWRAAVNGRRAGRLREAGIKLRELTWDKFAPALGKAKLVLISPDGAAARVPFAALPGNDQQRFLLEEVSIAYLPSPQALPALVNNGPPTGASPSLLLVGGVEFTAQDGEKWPPLPGTAAEVAAVRETLGRVHPGAAVNLLQADAATELAVRKGVSSARYVHFATHGYFSSRTAPGAASLPETVRLYPGVLSGLVLAAEDPAANLTATLDGRLTAFEVADLDLTRVELATLSACETGLGKDAAGEGLLGLQRAFHSAGARSVVGSLWSVPDNATRLLMTRFYENLWNRRLGKLESLLEAQRWMLTQGLQDPELRAAVLRGATPDPDGPADDPGDLLPPLYWAAFTLSGDWR